MRPGGYITMPTGARMPHLVTDVPTTSNGRVVVLETGEMEVTWSIDPQARWSDGLRVSSSDFAFFDENDYGDVSQTLAVEFVDADPGQIRALFATPTIGYLDAVGRVMPAHLLDPETVCEDSGFDWPSTGAFVIETVDSSRAALVRNEAYWKRDSVTAAQPYLDALEDSSLVFGETTPNGTFDAGMWAWLIGPLLDSVIFRVKPDEGESLEDLLAGALDGLDGKVGNPLSADRLAGLPDGVLVGEAQSGRIVQQLSMQFGDDDDLLQSVLFRQALVYALDTAALAEAEGRPVATSLLEPGGVGPWCNTHRTPLPHVPWYAAHAPALGVTATTTRRGSTFSTGCVTKLRRLSSKRCGATLELRYGCDYPSRMMARTRRAEWRFGRTLLVVRVWSAPSA